MSFSVLMCFLLSQGREAHLQNDIKNLLLVCAVLLLLHLLLSYIHAFIDHSWEI